MKNVLIVGAGRLGKGFIGETFDNAGWNITFLDKDPKVEEELKKQGCYHVKVHRVDEIQNRVIKNFKAYTCENGYAQKPIAGRRGDNVKLIGECKSVLDSTDGRFDKQESIYQNVWKNFMRYIQIVNSQ